MSVPPVGQKVGHSPSNSSPPPNPGFLLVGGRGTERQVSVYNPRSNKSCELPDLPEDRRSHSFCGQLLCGGTSGGYQSCLKFDGENFTTTEVTLANERSHHICWSVGDDVLLLGGFKSPDTTEIVEADGFSSSPSFNLVYPLR